MSHRVSRKTFRHFEMRQRRDLARFKAEVLDAVARMTEPEGGYLSSDALHNEIVRDWRLTRTFGNGETPEKSA